MHSGFGFGSAFGVLGRQDEGARLQQKGEPMSYNVLFQGNSSPCLCQICVVQANWAIWLPCSRHSVNIYETTSKSSCLGFLLNRTSIAQEIILWGMKWNQEASIEQREQTLEGMGSLQNRKNSLPSTPQARDVVSRKEKGWWRLNTHNRWMCQWTEQAVHITNTDSRDPHSNIVQCP